MRADRTLKVCAVLHITGLDMIDITMVGIHTVRIVRPVIRRRYAVRRNQNRTGALVVATAEEGEQ